MGNTYKRHLDTETPHLNAPVGRTTTKRVKAIHNNPLKGDFLVYDPKRNSFCKIFKGAFEHVDYLTLEHQCTEWDWDHRRHISCAWFTAGECCCRYKYGQTSDHLPQSMPQVVQEWIDEIEPEYNLETGYLNSALASRYDPEATLGLHSDDEKIFKKEDMTIVSLSFGETRSFRIEDKQSGKYRDVDIEHGDLLIMSGAMQLHYRHGIPSTGGMGSRLNFTLRHLENHQADICEGVN